MITETPVLNYETASQPRPLWLARLLCVLAGVEGLISAGFVLAAHLPLTGAASTFLWSEIASAGSGFALAAIAILGLFRVPGSRLGIIIAAIAMMVSGWAWQLTNLQAFTPLAPSAIAYSVVGAIDDAVVPVFLCICLMREPIGGCFSKR